MISMHATNKPFTIEKRLVYEAFKAVKSNRGAAGVDEQSIEQFEADLSGNLYKIWNRMSSGSYIPPPVRAVSIPKKSGGERILGVPTVADRVAQMVVKQVIEPDSRPDLSGRLLRIQAEQVGPGCRRGHAKTVLEIRLGFGV
jgi:RNA-directed DNA polymerase